MKKDLFADLEHLLGPYRHPLPPPQPGDWRWDQVEPNQSFEAYRWSRPARQTARRNALHLSRIGELTAAQEQIVTATADYLAVFFDLPVRPGASFDPAAFPAFAIRKRSPWGHAQLLTNYLLNEVLWLDRPEDALICLAVTAWDLWSADETDRPWDYVLGEAFGGHAGVWSLRHLGNPSANEKTYQRCLKRSFATATHEAAHVLCLEHCVDALCNMNGSACVSEADSQPLYLCPLCLRKLCWNRQIDLLPYLQRLRDFLGRSGFSAEAELYAGMMGLLCRDGRDRVALYLGPNEGASQPRVFS
jgi:archaemetzincin